MNRKNWRRSRLDNAEDAWLCAKLGHDWLAADPVTGTHYCRRRCLAFCNGRGDGPDYFPWRDWKRHLRQAEEWTEGPL